MGCPIFFKTQNEDSIVGLITGKKETVKSRLGENFVEMDSTMSEGAGEKHLPVVNIDGKNVCVKIGSVAHPMTEEHSIDWIYLETKEGGQIKKLDPSGEAKAEFALSQNDCPVAAYAYCNLHGFWKTEI